MPELPEVETTLRGIAPEVVGKKLNDIIVRQPQLRWLIPDQMRANLKRHRLRDVTRRAKYLFFHFDAGTVILHLGMSGHLRVLPLKTPAQKHDHVDFCFDDCMLRFTDPRRFGSISYTTDNPLQHPLLAKTGPEPLSRDFSGQYLFQLSRSRKVAVKNFIMNSHVVAGVGNIYATEALFTAGIRPQKPANKVSKAKYDDLCTEIKNVLQRAIKQGGTTLRDFKKSDGSKGYFQISLNVYGKDGEPCPKCGAELKLVKLGQRASVYCGKCQR